MISLLPSGMNLLEVPELQSSFGGSRNGKRQMRVGSGSQDKQKYTAGGTLSAWKQQLWPLCKGMKNNSACRERGKMEHFPGLGTMERGRLWLRGKAGI